MERPIAIAENGRWRSPKTVDGDRYRLGPASQAGGADFAFVQDGTRQGEAFRARQAAWYREALAGTAVIEARGHLDDRVEAVAAYLSVSGP